MESVNVKICVGTACYVLGGAEILSRLEELKEKYGDSVVWEGSPCLGLCKSGKENKAPFATVNGTIVDSATVEALEEAIASASAKMGADAKTPAEPDHA